MGTRSTITLSTLILSFVAISIVPANGLDCYQCDGTNGTNLFQCNEFLSDDIDIRPQSCDNVYGAKYCIKHVGRFEAVGLECFQCSSGEQWTCGDSTLMADTLKPESCDHVHNAEYCIKSIGLYGGGVGTKRFCSSADMGNQCHYVQNPGDELNYWTCIYTCSSDGCNPAVIISPSIKTLILLLSIIFYVSRR